MIKTKCQSLNRQLCCPKEEQARQLIKTDIVTTRNATINNQTIKDNNMVSLLINNITENCMWTIIY